MFILVDFSNVPDADRRHGVLLLCEKIVNAIGYARIGSSTRINIRLYDGWYENNTLTRTAQDVAAQVHATMPAACPMSDGTNLKKVHLNAELDYSLKIE